MYIILKQKVAIIWSSLWIYVVGMTNQAALKRLLKDLRDIEQDNYSIPARPLSDDMFTW